MRRSTATAAPSHQTPPDARYAGRTAPLSAPTRAPVPAAIAASPAAPQRDPDGFALDPAHALQVIYEVVVELDNTGDPYRQQIAEYIRQDKRLLPWIIGEANPSGKSFDKTTRVNARDAWLKRLAKLPRIKTANIHLTAANIHQGWTAYASNCWPREQLETNTHQPETPSYYFYEMMKITPHVLTAGYIVDKLKRMT